MLLFVGRVGCPNIETLHSLVGGVTLEQDREQLLAHVDTCDACHAAMIALIRPDAVKPSPVREHDTTIDRYQIEKKLGAGGMGVVFLAHDPELDRKIAVKLMRDPRGTDATERLRREARALAALSHPNVVAVFDVGEHAGQMFVAMEYVDGGSLRGWLGKDRTWREIVPVIVAAARGLAAAHAANLVHRDIKPENLLMGSDGRVRVSDFGLASIEPMPVDGDQPAESLTKTGTLMGTPAYMSPEQIFGEETDPRSDQFSLCATAYEAVYGKRPFTAKTVTGLAEVIERGELAEVDESKAPAWLRKTILRGLAVEPADRWPSLDALIAALERGMKRRGRAIAAGVLGIAIAGAALVAWQVAKPAARSCAGAGDIATGTWSPVRHAQLHALLVARSADVGAIDPRITGWFDAWSSSAIDACHTDEASLAPRRHACFERALRDIDAQLTRVIGEEIDPRSITLLLERLPRLEHCSPTSVLAEPPPPPPEIALRVQELDRRLLTLEDPLGPQRSLARIAPIAAEAETTHYAPLIARVALARGRWLDESGDRTGATDALRTAQQIAEANHDDFTAAEAAVGYVHAVHGIDHLEEALRAAELARSLIVRLGGAIDLESNLEINVGLAYTAVRKFKEAIAAFTKGCELTRSIYGDGPSYAECLIMLAQAYSYDHHEAEAKPLDARATKIIERLYGQQPELEVVNVLQKAQVELQQGHVAQALEMDEHALQLIKRFRPGSVVHANTEAAIAVDHVLLGNHELGFQHWGAAVAIYDQLHLEQELAFALDMQANSGLESSHYGEAIGLERRALAIMEPTLTPATELDFAAALTALANAMIASGDFGGARAPAERALALREKRNAKANQRGSSRWALAQALWVGDANDKRRAIDLARGGLTDLRGFLANFDQADPLLPNYRRMYEPKIAKIEAWLKANQR